METRLFYDPSASHTSHDELSLQDTCGRFFSFKPPLRVPRQMRVTHNYQVFLTWSSNFKKNNERVLINPQVFSSSSTHVWSWVVVTIRNCRKIAGHCQRTNNNETKTAREGTCIFGVELIQSINIYKNIGKRCINDT